MTLLVRIFLRGGADGLALAAPVSSRDDDVLAARRPSLHDPETRLPLDGHFSLHPALAPLLSFWRRGELALVHAAGTDDRTRSHFEAQDRLEQGARGGGLPGSGWIARWMHALREDGVPLDGTSALALGARRPEALRGSPVGAVFTRAEDRRIRDRERPLLGALESLYADPEFGARGNAQAELGNAGLSAMRTLERVGAVSDAPLGGGYPVSAIARKLAEIARMRRAGLSPHVATLDFDGWDTHVAQGPVLDANARMLAEGIAAFHADLGDMWPGVSVVVVSEFGRRVYESTGLGTDHGRGGLALLVGAEIRGGVHGDWPGLTDLEAPGDLRAVNDLRAIYAAHLEHSGVDSTRVFSRTEALTLY